MTQRVGKGGGRPAHGAAEDTSPPLFPEEARPPDAAALAKALGRCAPLWDRLVSRMAHRTPPVTGVWHFAGARHGWTMRLTQGDRIILYLTPRRGGFVAGVVLGEKAIAQAVERGLDARVLALLDEAPRHAEGRGARVTVAGEPGLRAVLTLASIKLG